MLAVSLQNEADVFKGVIRKQFQELHRYIDEQKATFLESIERKATQLITSIESQIKQTSDALQRLKEMQSSLEALSSESQLGFIQVSALASEGSDSLLSSPALSPLPVALSPALGSGYPHQTSLKQYQKRDGGAVCPARPSPGGRNLTSTRSNACSSPYRRRAPASPAQGRGLCSCDHAEDLLFCPPTILFLLSFPEIHLLPVQVSGGIKEHKRGWQAPHQG